MADIWMDVDAALAEVPVNLAPLTDDVDFKTREVAVAYDAAGMDLVWNFVTTAGAYTQTAVTPTTGGDYDWAHQGDGMYSIEIPASAGASINNDIEGFGWFSGVATGVLPWRGPIIGFRAAALNNALIDGGANLPTDVIAISGDSTAADNLETACDGGAYNVGGGAVVAASVTAGVTLAGGQMQFKKNVARANFAFPMFDSAGALKTGLTVTAVIRKDSGSFAALADDVAEIGTTGWYTVDWAQAETNADVIAFSATASGAVPTCYTILTQT